MATPPPSKPGLKSSSSKPPAKPMAKSASSAAKPPGSPVSRGTSKSQAGKKPQTPATADGKEGKEKDQLLKDLQDQIPVIKEQLEKEMKDRNYFQLESDKINSFWEITKKELQEVKADLRNKDREMEELEERHQVEIKVYKQKIKHLLYEHQNDVTLLKTETENSLKLQNDEHRDRETDVKKQQKSLKSDMKEVELGHQDVVTNLKQEHDKNITRLRQEHERNLKEMQQKYDKKMKNLREDLELRRKNEIHEVEERKNTHIDELMKKHDKAFQEIKAYYNDITLNNLELIKSLKEQVDELKKKDQAGEKLLMEVTQENKRLSEPLQKSIAEVSQLKHGLANYEKDKMALQNAKARIKVLEAELKSLKWEHEVLEQKFEQVQKERDDLYNKFVSSIYEVQQKSGLKNMLLEKKLETLSEALESKDAQLSEVIASANLDPVAVSLVTKHVDDMLEQKNQFIKDLQFELAKITKAHNDVVRVSEAKLVEFGIPVEELGLKLLRTSTPATNGTVS
eukprot:Phypoly_transcript_07678.p1 GENE.Phypoly_transcript_07678~~Phypoly_transcript_07678.p1  ORF type:complete len:511 (+),score=118.03 Phypoly_transcript_07678:41-1573(+)